MTPSIRSCIFASTLLWIATPIYGQDQNTEYFENAKSAFDKNDFESAYIHLKNSLQDDPAHLPSKLLMGQLLLVTGYTNEAIIELNEALEFGADYNLVSIPLAQAYLLLGNNQALLDLSINGLVPRNLFEISLLKGNAASNIGDSAGAKYWYEQAIGINPNNTRAINSYAGHLLEYNQTQQAKELINRAISLSPNSSRAWHLRGKLEQQSANFEQALEHYQRSYSLDQQDPLIKRSLASVYVELGEYASAQEYINEILAQTPDDPNALVLKGRILALTSEDELSRQALDDIAQKLSLIETDEKAKRSSLIFLSGLTAYLSGNFEVAVKEFELYVQSNRGNLNAIALLADTHLKLGQSSLALVLLESNERVVVNNPAISIILCDLYLANGKSYKCDTLLADLKRIHGDTPAFTLTQAKSLQQRQRYNEAITLLDEGLSNKESPAALLLYSTLYMQIEQPQKALTRIERLVQLSPQNLYFLNLKSEILIRLQDFTAANTIIDNILSQEPQYYSGLLNKARIAFLEANFESAEEILSTLLEIDNKNVSANILMGQTMLAQSQFDSALEHLKSARDIERTNAIARSLVIEVYKRKGDFSSALYEVEELLKSDLLNPEYLEQKAEILLELNQTEAVKTQLRLLYGQWQDNPTSLLRLSQLQIRANDFTGSENSLQRALGITPNALPIKIAYARLLLQINSIERAERLLNDLHDQNKANADILLMKGDLYFVKNELDTARQFYLESYQQVNSYKLALIKLYQLAIQGTGSNRFVDDLTPLIEEYPENTFQKHVIADFLLVKGRNKEASRYYRQLIKIEGIPNKHDIYNNLANIYINEDLKLAKSFIDKALELTSSPEILDTKGWILTKEGSYDEALNLLRQAYARQSNDPAIRYHLGYTLEKMGRTQEAKIELRAALASDVSFDDRATAEALYKTL